MVVVACKRWWSCRAEEKKYLMADFPAIVALASSTASASTTSLVTKGAVGFLVLPSEASSPGATTTFVARLRAIPTLVANLTVRREVTITKYKSILGLRQLCPQIARKLQ